MFFIQHDHGVVDGDHTNQPPVAIHHRGRDQVVLVERIGHIFLVLIDGDGVEFLFGDGVQHHIAPRCHQLAQRDLRHRFQARIDQHHVIKLFRQVIIGAHEINGLPYSPMLGRHDNLALHEATGRVLGVGQRLFGGDTLRVLKRVKDGLLLGLFEVFQQVDNIVAFHVTHSVGQNVGAQDADHLFADGLIQFRQDVAVEFLVIKPDQPRAVIGVYLLQQVGDIGRVQRLHQRDQLVAVIHIHREQNRRNGAPVQRIGIIVTGGFGYGFVKACGHVCPRSFAH